MTEDGWCKAAMAASAASEGGAQAAFVIRELAKLTVQLSHEQLQYEAAQMALNAMQALECHARSSIHMLIQALQMTGMKAPELAADATWILHKLTQRCDVTVQWVREADGLAAVLHAMVHHSEHENMVQCAVGIFYNLDGIGGLIRLLGAAVAAISPDGNGNTLTAPARLPHRVVATTLWSVYGLVQEECGSDKAALLRLIVQILAEEVRCSPSITEVQSACCSAICAIVAQDARLGAFFIELGGLPLLLRYLQRYTATRAHQEQVSDQEAYAVDASGLVCACVNTLSCLAKGSTMQAEVVRQHGALEVLAQLASGISGGDVSLEAQSERELEAAVWALGYLGGIGTVLQAMSLAPSSQGLLRGGLDVVAELASQCMSPQEVSLLPEVLRALLRLLCQMTVSGLHAGVRKNCVAAICSTIMGMAPHADPGQVPELDQAVLGLLEAQTQELLADVDIDIAEMTLESLGRLILVRPTWHRHLHSCNAEAIFSQRIRRSTADRRLLKYAFWASAALSGLPFVCRELQLQLRSPDTVDAAFCSIIDILDNDLEGDWVLQEAERCDQQVVPNVLRLISDAMGGFLADSVLQSRGCHCIGLLVTLAPPGTILPEAITAVFTAARRHPQSKNVVRDACYAFHALLERQLSCGGAGNTGSVRDECSTLQDTHDAETFDTVLNDGGAEAIARQAIADHGSAADVDLIEEAVMVLCALAGVGEALRVLAEAGPGVVRTVGVKAIGEVFRRQPRMLKEQATHIVPAVVALAAESIEDEALQQHAALLIGFCTSPC